MSINLSALMKQRYDTAANWTAQNTTLLAGEIGIESDTKKWKVGDGSTAWTSLVYAIGGTYPIVNADIAAAAAIAYSKLATLTSGNIVLGSAANVATSTAVTGDVTISNTGVTAIAAGVIVNADINASAAIVDTKLGTIATAGKVSNSATTATNANTASAIVARDASGNFIAGTITASLTGNASTVTTNANLTGDVTSVGNATAIAAGVIVNADVNASAAIAGSKIVAATTSVVGAVQLSDSTSTTSSVLAATPTAVKAAYDVAAAALPVAGGTMTGVLAVTAGTAALPGIAVSGDLNTGLVSPGADQLAITTGGTSRLAVSTTAVSSTLPVDVPLGAVGTPSLTFTGDLNTGLFSPGADTVALVTGGTERARIDSSGTLKTFGSTANSSVYNCDFRNSASTDLFRVRNDGYFITGSAASSPYNLTTGSAANVNMDGNGALQRVTSSLKYKRDVQDIVHGLRELLQLRAVTYKGKGENDGETVFGGLIAEEVDAAGLHEFVQYASDGSPDSLAYGNMVSLCVKAIQEQQAIISELQSKVAALEAA